MEIQYIQSITNKNYQVDLKTTPTENTFENVCRIFEIPGAKELSITDWGAPQAAVSSKTDKSKKSSDKDDKSKNDSEKESEEQK